MAVAPPYPERSTIEIFQRGRWVPAADIRAVDAATCRVEYRADYIFGAHPQAVALNLPVGYQPPRMVDRGIGLVEDLTPPSFLFDLVPQGKGRAFLCNALGLADADGVVMPLLMAGAFNPIGNLRIASAVDFFTLQAQKAASAPLGAQRGFALDDIVQRSADYLDQLSVHAMLAAGTTGVQGVAPKFLLATDAQGQWFADMALADDLARGHWLLKLPRGKSEADRAVLRNEAAYLRVAAACGLRVHGEPMLVNEMLFVPRFDRLVDDSGLHRLHQESLASVLGLTGFGRTPTQNALLAGLRRVAHDPLAETIEFLKRDVLNLALRNTDNHARNTAVQTLPGGRVQLTPVFDFAPMFLDPEVVVRGCHWTDADGKRLADWAAVLPQLRLPESEHAQVVAALQVFAGVVAALPATAAACGVEPEVLAQCAQTITTQAAQLRGLAPSHGR